MAQILWLDPEKTLSEELATSLEQENIEWIKVFSSEDALEKTQLFKPDLILIDSSGKNWRGHETCRQLKSNPDTENIPIILTQENESSNGSLQKAIESGANDVISLSGSIQDIAARIRVALRYKRTLSQLESLANQLNELNTELYERNSQVEKELYVARQLQQSLLPSIIKEETSPDLQEGEMISQFSKCNYKDENIRVCGVYLPCDSLGGDLYDVISFNKEVLGVSIADVSGHGVPAAFITAIYKASFYRTTHNFEKPGDVYYHLNNELLDLIKTGDYITGLYLRFMDNGRKLEYTGAGHPYPMLYKATQNSIIRLTENGSPLIWFNDMDYPTTEVELEPGDKILLFSDGITELQNPQKELYGEEALEKLFLELINKPSNRHQGNQILNEMIEILADYTEGHPLEDDMSLVLIEIS